MRNTKRENGFTVIEFIIAIVLLAVLAAVVLPALARSRGSGCQRPSCQNNLKQWGLVLKMYAGEARGERYPPMQLDVAQDDRKNESEDYHVYMATGPRVKAIYPEYLTDPAIAICPSDDERVEHLKADKDIPLRNGKTLHQGDWTIGYYMGSEGVENIDASYVYFGWGFDLTEDVSSDDQTIREGIAAFKKDFGIEIPRDSPGAGQLIRALMQAYRNNQGPKGTMEALKKPDKSTIEKVLELTDKNISSNGNPLDPLYKHGNGGGVIIYRLREGVERFFIGEGASFPGSLLDDVITRVGIMFDRFEDAGPTRDKTQGKFNHIPGGCNVLYLDGHVSFVKYPSDTLPVTPGMGALLCWFGEQRK